MLYYDEKPDSWVIVKITHPEEGVLFKVLCSWYGGYLGNDSWKISSRINKVEDMGHFYRVYNESGSIYHLLKEYEKMSALMTTQLRYYQKILLDNSCDAKIEVVDDQLQNF